MEAENQRLRARVAMLQQRCDDMTSPRPSGKPTGGDTAATATGSGGTKAQFARTALMAGHIAQLQRQVLRLTRQLECMADYTVEAESAVRDILAHTSNQHKAAEEAAARGSVPPLKDVVPPPDIPLYGVPSEAVSVRELCGVPGCGCALTLLACAIAVV